MTGRALQWPTRLLPALLLAICGVTVADYQAGLDAYESGDFDTAMKQWKAVVDRPASSENLAIYREALYAIAMLHWKGEGVAQDQAIATVWLKQAADINHPGAQVKLGYLYSTGQGVPQNNAMAAKYFRMAAGQGDPDALHNLAVMEQHGLLPAAESVRQGPISLPLPDGEAASVIPPQTEAKAKAEAETQAEAQDQAQAESQDQAQAQAQDQAQAQAQVGAQAEAKVEAPTAAAEFSSGEEAGVAWLLAQNPEHFTIQVIALRDKAKLEAFVTANADWSPFAVLPVANNPLPLWVLVQGSYADVEAARAAASIFPIGIQQRDKLWIRRFAIVQAENE